MILNCVNFSSGRGGGAVRLWVWASVVNDFSIIIGYLTNWHRINLRFFVLLSFVNLNLVEIPRAWYDHEVYKRTNRHIRVYSQTSSTPVSWVNPLALQLRDITDKACVCFNLWTANPIYIYITYLSYLYFCRKLIKFSI